MLDSFFTVFKFEIDVGVMTAWEAGVTCSSGSAHAYATSCSLACLPGHSDVGHQQPPSTGAGQATESWGLAARHFLNNLQMLVDVPIEKESHSSQEGSLPPGRLEGLPGFGAVSVRSSQGAYLVQVAGTRCSQVCQTILLFPREKASGKLY